MKSNLVAHLTTQEERDSFKQSFQNSPIVERLRDMMEKEFNSLLTTSMEDYETPCWAYKQADLNGYRRCLKQWMSLLDQGDK